MSAPSMLVVDVGDVAHLPRRQYWLGVLVERPCAVVMWRRCHIVVVVVVDVGGRRL
jgi:hypothetical protein